MEQFHNDSHWPMNCSATLNCTNLTADVIEFVRNETCTNDYCETDDDYIDRIEAYMFPSVYEWILIGLHCMVFIVGLVGNFLVCLAVYRNHTMRTVTNMFIVNLAIADFLVIFLCLPPTVLWDITETWFMGSTLCKIIPYFQTVSVSVSVLTLTFISVDRWYAICHPLKFRSTIGRAKTAIAAIWIISLLIDIPELVVLETRQGRNLSISTVYFTQCQPSWDDETDLYSQLVKFALLYALPLLFISVTYYQIARVLWRSARLAITGGNRSNTGDSTDDHNSTTVRLFPKQPSNNHHHHHGHHGGNGGNGAGGASSNKDMLTVNSNASIELQLRSRRKAAKMLVVVVIVFAVCYFPVHLVSILRYTIKLTQNDYTVAAALVSHWLCYFNSAINPVIYNFMSEKFRREFGIAMKCCSADEDGRRRRQNRTTHNLSPSPSVVTSLTRTPKQQHQQQRQSAQQLGLFGGSSSQQPRRSSTKSGNSSPIFKSGKNGSTPSEAETILLCTMNSSAYTHVSTVDE
ncbi:orexin/Hypocretin receptor type 1-like isoform X1 [Daphnia pulicaria]|uniref:orexin/Hypocretin receptor type 1-like isoform X1 n=1 Tax=Daphnia pulicaria TaxID=35523 RepID=UPI001EEB5056|nr:orexin/Hypocretin receptor type 1-like isoform X1 [Daphnia pulicaria]